MLYGKGSQVIKPKVQVLAERMLSLPDQVIELLGDGKPHSLVEISRAAKLSERQAEKVLDFLDKYGFANLRRREKAVQIDPEFLGLLKELP